MNFLAFLGPWELLVLLFLFVCFSVFCFLLYVALRFVRWWWKREEKLDAEAERPSRGEDDQ